MKNTLVTLAIVPLTLLSACAQMSPQSSAGTRTAAAAAPAAPSTKAVASTTASDDDVVAASLAETLPSVELTEDLIFKILTSEIAAQRGQWQGAYVTLLALAQQTRDPRLARRAAEVALAAKQPDETLAAIRLWHTLAPNSDEATQYFLGGIMLTDDLSEAQPIFAQRLKAIRPQARGLLIFQIQRLLASAKDKAAGFAMLETLLKPYLAMPESHLALAQGALVNGNATRAQAEARIALAAKPDSELAILTLAQVLPNKADAAAALASFLASHPQAREVRLAYARLLIDQKQFELARTEFETILTQQPDDLTSLYALGILGTQTNTPEVAEKYLSAYVTQLNLRPDPKRDPTQALLILAKISEQRKDTVAALAWLAQIESGDAFIGAQIRRAQLLAKGGDVAGGRKLLTDLRPDNDAEQVQLLLAEGQLLRDVQQIPEAIKVLQAGLMRFPENTDLMYDYAMLAEKINQIELMETLLRKVIALAPKNQHAYNALGYSLAERNMRLPEAFKLIEKALELAPEDPFILDSMGWVNFRLGNLSEAENLLRRAYKLRPDAEIAAHLGEVLWVKGLKSDAEKFWRDAKAKDPQNDTLKSTLVRLQVNL